ncbi:hypothetical protein BS50DRAFT_503251 [Corynespora cassiicola Philippines]|uniref:Uncharacterized protein n=1 Tax=Corynespora cassiicola Philippines TaxID=1448308 RepID=A0A2T2NA26_CORCC|nr:hypothetical protein BS50DRAFT_503251 [Corynespora cassiicola Philippines]
MSTPTGSGPSDGNEGDRRKSLGKYVKRMSSVFKREKSSKSVAPATATASSSAAAPATPATPAPARKEEPVTQELNRSALQHERARALFEKYGLTLETNDWIAPPAHPISVQRVEKPIRMRVHRNCHHCGTTFGADKTCSKCEHKRCKKCPRYPKKKAPAEKGKQKEAGPERPKKKKLLTVQSKTGGELVYQPVRQRVRRTCHKCEALFIPPTATVCESCRHVRCTKCPREPAKLNKWPRGYPGDAEPESDSEAEQEQQNVRRIWRKPRTRVRWECEECQSLFIEGIPQCPGCGHERCDKCTRKPLKRVKKDADFSPDVIRAVEAKLRALHVDQGDDTQASGAEAT